MSYINEVFKELDKANGEMFSYISDKQNSAYKTLENSIGGQFTQIWSESVKEMNLFLSQLQATNRLKMKFESQFKDVPEFDKIDLKEIPDVDMEKYTGMSKKERKKLAKKYNQNATKLFKSQC